MSRSDILLLKGKSWKRARTGLHWACKQWNISEDYTKSKLVIHFKACQKYSISLKDRQKQPKSKTHARVKGMVEVITSAKDGCLKAFSETRSSLWCPQIARVGFIYIYVYII